MSAQHTVEQAGALALSGAEGSAPAVSSERVALPESLGAMARGQAGALQRIPSVLPSRPGAELAAILTAAETSDAAHREDSIVLDAEKLEVYGLALELHAFSASKVPTLSRVLRDQLERASLSVILNLAEGGGRRSRKDKARYYTYARGSATEVAACFDVLKIRKLAPASECARGRSLAVRVTQMLTKLCAALQSREAVEAAA